MKKIFASALAALMVAGMAFSASATAEGSDKLTAKVVKADWSKLKFDGVAEAGEGWENAQTINLYSKTNTKDSVSVKLMWDEDFLYVLAVIKDSDWNGDPNKDFQSQGEHADWTKALGIDADNFGFSILVDELNQATPFNNWSTIHDKTLDAADLGKASTTWCNRYKFHFMDPQNGEPSNGKYNYIGQRAPWKIAGQLNGVQALQKAGLNPSQFGYLLRVDTAGGAGRYWNGTKDVNFKNVKGQSGLNPLFEMTPVACKSDGTTHTLELAIPFVSVGGNPYIGEKKDGVQTIQAGTVMDLEMKYGSGNDSWYFNCDPNGEYSKDLINVDGDAYGDKFEIFKANTQWGKMELVDALGETDAKVIGKASSSSGDGSGENNPSTADLLSVAGLVALASAAVVISKKRK